MKKNLAAKLLVMTACLILAASGAQAGTPIFPTVDFSFDPESFIYTYTVTLPANATYPFGSLQINAMVRNVTPTGPWRIYDPIVDGVSAPGWFHGTRRVAQDKSMAWWQAATKDAEVYPDEAPWVGIFSLKAPNTSPVAGFAMTKDGSPESKNVFETMVPGPKNAVNVPAPPVPEPASIALAALGLGSVIARRKAVAR